MHQHFPPLLPFKLIYSPVRIPVLKTGQLGLELGQVDQVNLEPAKLARISDQVTSSVPNQSTQLNLVES